MKCSGVESIIIAAKCNEVKVKSMHYLFYLSKVKIREKCT